MREIQATTRICVSVCEEHAASLPQAVERASELGDAVELRLDYLTATELDAALDSLEKLSASSMKPFILTLRPAEQGGRREIDFLNRIIFWLDQLGKAGKGEHLFDIELDAARMLSEKGDLAWNRIICSHHDFSGASGDLGALYSEMAGTPAGVIKIAIRVEDAADCIPFFKLIERARAEGREIVALAMGASGLMTRILGPSRGAFLTYAAIDKEHATAPGQPTAVELRELYRIHKITEHTAVTGLIGGRVSYSVSPHIHNAAFAETGVDAVYIPFEVHDAGSFLRRMADPRSREMKWKLRGLGVTAPHKLAVMEHLDWIEPSALEIGAVNTILVEGESLRGYNTDAAGFLLPLTKRADVKGKKVAVIGAGGAARSALWSLGRAGAAVTLFARNPLRAQATAEQFGARVINLEGARFDDFEIVVNATPLGTRGVNEDETPAASSQLRGVRLAYDLVYNPRETRFLMEARQAGCETLSGMEMLVAQAAEQFRLWTGSDAPEETMLRAASRALESF
jgi:3-dehydroquinate dehydratase/shikimate dehydrogenase